MAGFFLKWIQPLRDRKGTDMLFLCRHLLSERGEASQTVLAQEIISNYRAMNAAQRASFFEMLCREFGADDGAIQHAIESYQKQRNSQNLARLSNSVEAPRQELFRRINTAPGGTQTLVTLRQHLREASKDGAKFEPLDSDLRHLFRSWFNRGFLHLERISWSTSAIILEKLIHYESVHEINGWKDLRRRLEADRRCFAFFHPALPDDPVIFVEVALTKGVVADVEPLLDIAAPVLPTEKADTAVFYSINNCLQGLRNIPFGNFLIKQVVTELAAELPNITNYSTLSPLPSFARTLRDRANPEGFTQDRLARLLADYGDSLTAASRMRTPVEAFFHLLKEPVAHRDVLAPPLHRLALAYLTKSRSEGKLSDSVATFHLSNGARLDRINPFGNLKPYGLEASYGLTVNYRYKPDELEENHERFVSEKKIRVSSGLFKENKAVAAAWDLPPLDAVRKH